MFLPIFIFLLVMWDDIFADSWKENWVYSEHSGREFGKFVLTAGKFFNDPEKDKGRKYT